MKSLALRLGGVLAVAAVFAAAFVVLYPRKTAPGPERLLVASSYQHRDRFNIWSMAPDGTARTLLVDELNVTWDPALSPDGKWLAYCGGLTPDDPHTDLFLRPAAGGGSPRLLTHLPAQSFAMAPRFSADSRHVLYTVAEHLADGPPRLSLIEATLDGGPVRIVGPHMLGAWSADGARLAYTAFDGDKVFGARIEIHDEKTGAISRPFGEEQTLMAAFSPDGKRLAYVKMGGMGLEAEIWVANVDGSLAHQVSPADGTFKLGPEWSPGGGRVYYSAIKRSSTPVRSAVYSVSPEGAEPRAVTEFDANYLTSPAASMLVLLLWGESDRIFK